MEDRNRHIPSDALVDDAYGAWVNAGMAGKTPRDRIAAALEVAKRCGWLTEAAEPAPVACACGLSGDEHHPDCPHDTTNKAIRTLRAYQRHHVLRQYGDNGHVLPESLNVSRALDVLIEQAETPR